MSKIPALVLGMFPNGLGITRSLAGRGVPVTCVDNDRSMYGMRTRFGRKRWFRALHGPELIEDMLRIKDEFEVPPVVVLTRENSVRTVSEFRAELEPHFRLHLAPHRLVYDLDEKNAFQAMAEAGGFPIPRALALRTEDDFAGLADLRYPVILKPAAKSREYMARFKKVYKFDSRAEVEALYREARALSGELIVQEYIPGGDSDIYFCLMFVSEHGAAHPAFVGRKITLHPAELGTLTRAIPAPEAAAELTDTSLRFFKSIGYFGMCSMEYKRDARDGRFYMIEPTVSRADYQETIALLNGVDPAYAHYLEAIGQPVDAAVQPVSEGIAYVNHYTDRWVGGRAAMPPGCRYREIDFHYRWDDPGPALAQFAERVKIRLGLAG